MKPILTAEVSIANRGDLLEIKHPYSRENWETHSFNRPSPVERAEAHKNLVDQLRTQLLAIGWEPDAWVEHPEGFVSSPEVARDLCVRNAQSLKQPHKLGMIVNEFLHKHLSAVAEAGDIPRVPGRAEAIMCRSPESAALMTIPPDAFEYLTNNVRVYRLGSAENPQGLAYEPKSDVRTTEGSFHIVAGVGDPVPSDKRAVPLETAAKLIKAANNPPAEMKQLPFTVGSGHTLETNVAMVFKVYLEPEVSGQDRKYVLVQLQVPGELVGGLHFTGEIFPYGGDPFDPQKDPTIDPEWCGHVGYITLAPHLCGISKKDAGLKHFSEASEREKKEGMAYSDEKELYNNGKPFTVHLRDEDVTYIVITDNYFGYLKKMTKNIVDYCTKLAGDRLEEHAGGALYRRVENLGTSFEYNGLHRNGKRNVTDLLSSALAAGEVQRYQDTDDPSIIFFVDKTLPLVMFERGCNIRFDLLKQRIMLSGESGHVRQIHLDPKLSYMLPNGDEIRMVETPQHQGTDYLVKVDGEVVVEHKPFTVSGGGKTELAKRLRDLIRPGRLSVLDFEGSLQKVKEIVEGKIRDQDGKPITLPGGEDLDFRRRFREGCGPSVTNGRPILGTDDKGRAQSIRSLQNLLTPDDERYRPEYNEWLRSIPSDVKYWVYFLKSVWTEEMGDRWPEWFSVDSINERQGVDLKFGRGMDKQTVPCTYLRLGTHENGSSRWYRTSILFHEGIKLQIEDDLTVSRLFTPAEIGVKFPAESLSQESQKLVLNFEAARDRSHGATKVGVAFQRPDAATGPGKDPEAEEIFARSHDLFTCNIEPLSKDEVAAVLRDAKSVRRYHPELVQRMVEFMDDPNAKWLALPDHWRVQRDRFGNPILDDETKQPKVTTNPRFQQPFIDPDESLEWLLSDRALHFRRQVKVSQQVYNPVSVVIPAMRFDKERDGFPALAVNGPIHAMEMPELLISIASSLTVKSRSTSGPGSEGAGTKKPFMELSGLYELAQIFVDLALTGQDVWVTSAGRIGPNLNVDHDLSYWAAELFGIMQTVLPKEKLAIAHMKKHGYVEELPGFWWDAESEKIVNHESPGAVFVDEGRSGHPITHKFQREMFGLITSDSENVLDEEHRRPRLQDEAVYAKGQLSLIESQRKVAEGYLQDGVFDRVCFPVQKIVEIMANGVTSEGWSRKSPEFRKLFTRDAVLSSDWYAKRLEAQRKQEWIRLEVVKNEIKKEISAIEKDPPAAITEKRKAALRAQLQKTEGLLSEVSSKDYLRRLRGHLGRNPGL
ncbi:MAG: hypothetical protein J5J00_04210, partial [Deltaproteobacteria bacterium]|nr:hypothetical protein [Deltaproteobacteria bacterium]